jgi:PIN domain nuclease of toxin-antitoxin system
LAPERLSPSAADAINTGRAEGSLACSDIVLWELAMLATKGRITIPVPIDQFLEELIQALRLQVLPISPAVAARAQDTIFEHGDPADRLIAATAMHHAVPLVSADRKLARVTGLIVLW